MRYKVFGLAALLLAACNPVAQMEGGEERIAEFQAAYSQSDLDALYALVGPEFRKISDREDFANLHGMIHGRLGDVVSSERVGFSVNTSPMGTMTVVTMETQFEDGVGLESFTFLGSGEDLVLEGWNVNSDRLVLTPEEAARLAEDEDSSPSVSPPPVDGAQP